MKKNRKLGIVLWDGENYSVDWELLPRIERLEKRFKEIKGVDTRLDNIMKRLLDLERWRKELEKFLRWRMN